MAESASLCSDPCTVDFETPLLKERFPSLNSTIEEFIGDFNRSQFVQALLVSFAAFFDTQQTFISVFTDSHSSWHCTNDQLLLDQSSCNKGSGANICQLPRGSWSWDFPVSSSIISEWGLECESFFITGLPASSFFFGCLVGGLALGTLADSSLGRKNMLFLCCLMMSVSSFLTIFSTNIWIYSALRFLCGFAKAPISTSYLVLATELVGKRWRGQVGAIGFFCATTGFVSLPAMAYINRGSSWRNIYIWTSIPTILYSLLVHIFVHESPRWLLVRGRKDEAVAALKSLGSTDRHCSTSLSICGLEHEEESSIHVDIYSALKILLQKPWALRRLLIIMAIGFGIGLVYYGMPLALGNLSFNLYLSVTFNALSEIPAALLTFFLIDSIDRRSSILGFSILSGIFSILSIMKGEIFTNLQIVFELSSFFCGCTAFNILLIYTLELFPTCVRNSAISLIRQSIVFSGVLSPVLVAAGRRDGNLLSYGVFGLVVGTSGFFAVWLPETRGTTLSDTMEEEERKEITVFVDLT